MNVVERAPAGIAEYLDRNPVTGEARCGARRFWTGREIKILKDNYPVGGLATCVAILPGRSAKAIYQKAGELGLRKFDMRGRVHARQAWTTNAWIDDFIRRTYETKPEKNAIRKCADTVGRPRWWVSKRAAQLGLVQPRFRQPEWCEAETTIVAENAHKRPSTIRAILKRHGFDRSDTAIVVKLKRLGADRTDPDHLNGNQLAGVMGVDRKTVARWIDKGWLTAKRRENSEKDDFWWIHRRDIARFIVGNVAVIDLRKVDKFWFVDLLVHEGRKSREAAE